MASVYVRALCLEGSAPHGWNFDFLFGPKVTGHIKFLKLFRYRLIYYTLELIKIRLNSQISPYIYFIKPNSVLLLFVSRYILRLKTFIDVNDPLHLPEHLGRFSKYKFKLMLMISNGAIFESQEYKNYYEKNINKKSILIEDTPQFEISFINYHQRQPLVIWYGSPETSKVLLEYIQFLKEFSKYGYKILFLGASPELIDQISKNGVNVELIKTYDHKLLVDTVSMAAISFIPMPNTESYALRGNLKAKFSMACGCITIASNLPMHSRLITNDLNGYLFDGFEDFSIILKKINEDLKGNINKIGRVANFEVISKFNRISHAKKICRFFESFNK